MQAPPQVAHSSAIGAFFAWLISLATTAEPLVSTIAGLGSIICTCFGIAWYWRNRHTGKAP